VHPPPVSHHLEAEAQAPHVDGPGHHEAVLGLLGRGLDVGEALYKFPLQDTLHRPIGRSPAPRRRPENATGRADDRSRFSSPHSSSEHLGHLARGCLPHRQRHQSEAIAEHRLQERQLHFKRMLLRMPASPSKATWAAGAGPPSRPAVDGHPAQRGLEGRRPSAPPAPAPAPGAPDRAGRRG